MTVLRWDGFLPATPQTFSWEGTVCKPFAPPEGGVPKHTDSLAHERSAALPLQANTTVVVMWYDEWKGAYGSQEGAMSAGGEANEQATGETKEESARAAQGRLVAALGQAAGEVPLVATRIGPRFARAEARHRAQAYL